MTDFIVLICFHLKARVIQNRQKLIETVGHSRVFSVTRCEAELINSETGVGHSHALTPLFTPIDFSVTLFLY